MTHSPERHRVEWYYLAFIFPLLLFFVTESGCGTNGHYVLRMWQKVHHNRHILPLAVVDVSSMLRMFETPARCNIHTSDPSVTFFLGSLFYLMFPKKNGSQKKTKKKTGSLKIKNKNQNSKCRSKRC